MAFEAARIAIEHMTPVILLSDAFIGNGSSAWRIPEADEYPEIKPRFVPEALREQWSPYKRDDETLARYWAVPALPVWLTVSADLRKTPRQEPYRPIRSTTRKWCFCAARKWHA